MNQSSLCAETLKGYLDAVATVDPAPGGGSALAVIGSLGASLLCKAASITLSSGKSDQAASDRLTDIVEIVEPVRKRFMTLIDRDARCFSEVMAALCLRPVTDEEKNTRRMRVDAALAAAGAVACDIASSAAELRNEIIEPLTKDVSRSLASDVRIAQTVLEATYCGAMQLVEENLRSLKDATLAEELKAACDELEQAAQGWKTEKQTSV